MGNSKLAEEHRDIEARTIMQLSELLAKVGGAGLAFVYISGYFIVNSYLSGFGIKRDGSDIFKATYIYVGSFYLLFLSIIAVAICGLKLLYDSKKRREAHAVTLEGDGSILNQSILKRAYRVWAGVLFFLESCIVVQIYSFTPERSREYMLQQLILLLSVGMYQFTYYRSLHSYGWDRDSKLIQRIRTRCLWVQAALWLLIIDSFVTSSDPLGRASIVYHQYPVVDLTIYASIALSTMVVFFPLALSSARRQQLEQDGYQRPIIDLPFGLRKATLAEILLASSYVLVFSCAFWPLWYRSNSITAYSIRWRYIEYADLFLLVGVLSGVIMQSAGMGLRRKAGHKQGGLDGQPTGAWTRWILRVTGAILLYIATTLSYAYIIYDHIPLSKNGGDYTTATRVKIFLRDDTTVQVEQPSIGSRQTTAEHTRTRAMSAKEQLQVNGAKGDKDQGDRTSSFDRMDAYPCLKDISLPCRDLIILDQDSSFLYVTKADGICKSPKSSDVRHCGPAMWRSGFDDSAGPFRPYVLAISLRVVGSIGDECGDGPATPVEAPCGL